MTEKQLAELLASMSLEEKAGQLLQFDGAYLGENVSFETGPAAEAGYIPDDRRLCGSVLNIIGADRVKDFQHRFIENHPHHIPLLFMLDIINGYKTVFPIPLAQGCTFSPGLVRQLAQAAAREGYTDGMHVNFSPMADLVTDCRWGRVMESTGEDPWLNAQMAAAAVEGYQGEGVDCEDTLAACLKHFAGYGLPIAGREYFSVEMCNRTLRDDYLTAYKAAVDAGCRMVMTSFNTLDRVPSSANKPLMRGILRGEMGFDGVLIADYNAIGELIPNGIAEDKAEASRLAIEAGVDIDMASACYVRSLPGLVRDGVISEELLDEAVMRVLRLKNELGLFENPYRGADAAAHEAACADADVKALIRQAAADSFVMLKNENDILPLSKDEKVAFIGPYVHSRSLHGAWSNFCDETKVSTIAEAVAKTNACADFAAGCHILPRGSVMYGFGKGNRYNVDDETTEEQLLAEALECARSADKVVMCIGEHRLHTGEGGSRVSPTIPEIQVELLCRVHEVNDNITLIIFSGRPLILTDIMPLCRSAVMVWFPGDEGAGAIADVLYGEREPGGRLSMGLPRAVGQCPITYRQLSSGRPLPVERPETRFMSMYQDCLNTPLYPFGYGLGYTTFTCTAPELSDGTLTADGAIIASATVTNTGSRAGRQVVQLYIRDMVGSVCRPIKELHGVEIVTLEPGQSQTVSFSITEDMLRFYDINMDYVSEPGLFQLWIGFSSAAENPVEFRLI